MTMPEEFSYRNVVAALVKAIPEFGEGSKEWDPELPYDAFGNFALYLCDLLKGQSADSDLVARCVRFLEQMARSNDDEVVNLLVVGALEVISDDPQCRTILCSRLEPQVAALFDEVDAFWGSGSFGEGPGGGRA